MVNRLKHETCQHLRKSEMGRHTSSKSSNPNRISHPLHLVQPLGSMFMLTYCNPNFQRVVKSQRRHFVAGNWRDSGQFPLTRNCNSHDAENERMLPRSSQLNCVVLPSIADLSRPEKAADLVQPGHSVRTDIGRIAICASHQRRLAMKSWLSIPSTPAPRLSLPALIRGLSQLVVADSSQFSLVAPTEWTLSPAGSRPSGSVNPELVSTYCDVTVALGVMTLKL